MDGGEGRGCVLQYLKGNHLEQGKASFVCKGLPILGFVGLTIFVTTTQLHRSAEAAVAKM